MTGPADPDTQAAITCRLHVNSVPRCDDPAARHRINLPSAMRSAFGGHLEKQAGQGT